MLEEAPESPERIEAIENRLMLGGFGDRMRRVDCGPAPMEAVLLAHDADYVDALEKASLGDEAALRRFQEPDTQVGSDTFDCAMASAGAVVRAVDAVFARTVKNAFCAVRPPGHHASRNRASGFCYLNNAAIGALWAEKRYKLERIMVLDFDAHHARTCAFSRFFSGRFSRTDAWIRSPQMRFCRPFPPALAARNCARWLRRCGSLKSNASVLSS